MSFAGHCFRKTRGSLRVSVALVPEKKKSLYKLDNVDVTAKWLCFVIFNRVPFFVFLCLSGRIALIDRILRCASQ